MRDDEELLQELCTLQGRCEECEGGEWVGCEGVRGGSEAVTWGGSGGGHTGCSETATPTLGVLEQQRTVFSYS